MTFAKANTCTSPRRRINDPLGDVVKTCKQGHAYTPGAGCYRCHLDRIAAKRILNPEWADKTRKSSVEWARANAYRYVGKTVKRYREDPDYRERSKATHRANVARRATEDPQYLLKKREAEQKRLSAVRSDPKRYADYLERNRLQLQRRRARLKDCASPGVTVPQWREICAKNTDANGQVVCAYCREPCVPTIDHVVPLARGGRDEPSNVVPACKPCNSSKNDRLLSEWRGRIAA